MKVQLVFAPPVVKPALAELGEGMSPPLGCLYLASYLREKMPGVELRITDGVFKGYQKTLEEIRQFGPDVLGVSFYTPTALSAYELVDTVKREAPDTLVALGGPHATALPEEGLRKSQADVAVVGEGEVTFHEIVSALSEKKKIGGIEWESIQSTCFRRDGEIFHAPLREPIEEIDTIPVPAYDLVNLKEYRGWYLCRQTPETSMIFSRGCPFQCTFCSNLVWKTPRPNVRLRSPAGIADEMEMLAKEYGIREIFDNSDEFNNNLRNALAICDELKRRKLGVTWKTQLRAHPLTGDLVRGMAEAGCWYIHLGVESGNEETLKGIHKQITLPQVKEACRLLHDSDIRILALFMLFNVWEDEGSLRFEDAAMTGNTLRFATELVDERLIDYFGWSITTPYPGSVLYDTAQKFGLVKPELFENWDAWLRDDSFVMKLPGLLEKDMARLKTAGSKLRARCMMRSGNIRVKDFFYIGKKILKLVQNELFARRRA